MINNSRSAGVAVNSHSQHLNAGQRSSDEIHLFELAVQLWREKFLIALITLAMTAAAVVYVLVTPPRFASQVILSSAPIGAYGELMAKMQDQKKALIDLQTGRSAIAMGRNLSNDAFELFASNLDSLSSRQQFVSEALDWQGLTVTVTQKRKTTPDRATQEMLLTVQATGPDAEAAQAFLNEYLAYVAEQTRLELNAYFSQSLGTDQLITADMLYTLEQPAAVNSQPVKPRIPLILALGFVVGGMLGVFVALVRGVLKKQRQRV